MPPPPPPVPPVKLTAEVQAAILRELRAGSFRGVAAEAAGISVRTFERAMKAGHEDKDSEFVAFRKAVLEAEKAAEIEQLKRVLDAGRADWKAAAWFLERKFPKRWGRKQHVELAGDKNRPIRTDVTPAIERLRDRLMSLRVPDGCGDGSSPLDRIKDDLIIRAAQERMKEAQARIDARQAPYLASAGTPSDGSGATSETGGANPSDGTPA